MFVKDVMSAAPTTVTPGTPVKEAASILEQRQISSLPVVDGNGKLCGVVTEADIIREAFGKDPRAHLIPSDHAPHSEAHSVSDVMTPHVVTALEFSDASEAAELMTSTSIKSLPVLDESGRLVGIVSRSDLVRARARADDVIEREVDAVLVSFGHTDWLVNVSDGRVHIDGPETPRERAIAEVAAAGVAGVTAVSVG